jgi:hypothetical protein
MRAEQPLPAPVTSGGRNCSAFFGSVVTVDFDADAVASYLKRRRERVKMRLILYKRRKKG